MTKEIKQRIDQIKNGEVPQGYKKTKIGIVPNEWEENKLKDIAPLQRGFDLPSYQINKGVYPICCSNGITGYHNEFKVKGPGVWTGRSGTIGKVFYTEKNYWAHNTSLWVTNFINSIPKYIFYLYTFIDFSKYDAGSTVPTLNRNDIHSLKISIPSIAEQQKISEILSTQDKVIELKEKLLKEKEKQKKYLVQSLVTGKKRLKGFNGEWKKVKLGNLMNENNEFVGDRNIKPVAIGVYGIRQREDIFSKDLSKNYSRNKVFKNNQICFGIGTNQIVYGVNIVNKIYCVSPAYKVLDIVNIDPYYLKLLLDINNLRLSSLYLIISARQGKSVDFDGLFNEEFDIPLFEEQKAIAEILTTADKELKLLQEELEEEKRKKKALMQLLLTGIVRVKV
ncbi:restriction endonuclease subunit S [Candidatus Arthromitus sp. SFB-turkey]|uniref:restriction endonuclease subunit S n=1 Tax=Candidatus Arthromitus sp. SFB-turkey TaxID=1840217 RepID=UPI0007F54843|nr:restriction endonuclease subunit S [Candidatus Arthromitus sp. SFB-turkey]OAT86875.1 hypothetical protein A6P36_04865 [Candidatus Arthromitus sp. SFB-turkey]